MPANSVGQLTSLGYCEGGGRNIHCERCPRLLFICRLRLCVYLRQMRLTLLYLWGCVKFLSTCLLYPPCICALPPWAGPLFHRQRCCQLLHCPRVYLLPQCPRACLLCQPMRSPPPFIVCQQILIKHMSTQISLLQHALPIRTLPEPAPTPPVCICI